MPPPHFQSSIPTTANNNIAGSSSQSNNSSQLSDLPKVQRQLVRDVIHFIRLTLVTDDAVPSPTNKNTTAAYDAIRKLVSDPILQATEDSSSSQAGRGGKTATQSGQLGEAAAQNAFNEAGQIRKQVGTITANTLSRIFSDEMDQDSKPLTQLLLSYLFALHTVLDPMCIVLEWWDVLIRPILKNPNCNPSIARKAHALVVWVMRSTPSTNYVDEPTPKAVWPAAPQSAVAAEAVRSTRQPGTAPYPVSSTRAPSQSRSSEDGDARRLALFSTKINRGKDGADPLRRFTERIFDMYTSEASSAGMREIEDDDIKEVGIDQPSPSEESTTDPLEEENGERIVKQPRQQLNKSLELDVGSTWKGNLEAIILTFGEERPKAFFHHLSESFLEPSSRIPILLLLTIFFRISSLHAYHVVSTPFVRFLLLSLQMDTSKTAAALGSSALATLIPHIPNWVANGGAGGLPAFLSILARIIDWRKLGPQWEDRESALVDDEGKEMEEWAQVQRISKRLNVRSDIHWKRLGTESDNIAPAPPDAEKLFTFLYGIFPCNVIRFLRAPIDYLRKAEYESPFQADWDDIIDEIAVQNSSAPILRRHVLHPSLVDMDAESEISDKQRWRDHDAADITAECVCLYIGVQFDDSHHFWTSLESHRPSIVDQLPSLLNFRSSSGSFSSTSGLPNQRIVSAATSQANNSFIVPRGGSGGINGDETPMRFYRKRSVSENLGRRGSVESPLIQSYLNARKRDSSMQPAALQPSSRGQLLSTMGNESDQYLQNHIRLRYGPGLNNSNNVAGDRTPSGSGGDPLSRSSSIHSHLKTFNIARTNLTSQLMSPTSSQQPLAPDATTTTSGTPAKESTMMTSPTETSSTSEGMTSPVPTSRRSTTSNKESTINSPNVFNTVTSPRTNLIASVTGEFLGSPALGGMQTTRSVLKEEVKQTIAYLKQENLQLRNELNYEIGQKDQMLRHIGRIHRDRIKDTVLEEERQNLYANLRSLRAQLRTIRASQELNKAETNASKNRHASWENELNAKLKAFREEKKVWAKEVRQLQIAKEDNISLITKLEGQLHDNANEVFSLREQCKRDAKKVSAIQEYEEKMRKMEECLKMWDEDMQKFDRQREEMEKMAKRYEELAMLFDATEIERRKVVGESSEWKIQVELLEKELKSARLNMERQMKVERSLLFGVERGLDEGTDSNVKTQQQQQHQEDDEEKVRLRLRIQQLEEEVLQEKAQKEDWRMEQLWNRLKEQQTRDGMNDHDVAPMRLEL